MQEQLNKFLQQVEHLFSEPNSYRSILILLIAIIIVYWISHFVAKGIIKVAQVVATHTDNETDEERYIRLRQIETYLSVTVALVRVGLFCILGFFAWTIFKPEDSLSLIHISEPTRRTPISYEYINGHRPNAPWCHLNGHNLLVVDPYDFTTEATKAC